MIRKIFTTILVFFFVLVDIPFNGSLRSNPSDSQAERLPEVSNQYLSNDVLNGEDLELFERSITRFIRYWGLAGASVAIANEGKLVYAKGFGYADMENEIEMQPYHLLRVASVSKLITATAIMKLIEEGRLELNQQVFGEDGILDNPIYKNYIDDRIEAITVKDLLNHSGGWTTRWGDQLFMHESIARQLNRELPLSKDDVIEFTLGKRLHFTPGTRSSYSNFGYLVLERVIEKVAKSSYERFVKKSIFHPIGVYDAFIAHNYDSLRYPLEVRYYEVPEAEPVPSFDGQQEVQKSRGGNDIRMLGAAGGWVISSVSLTKFLLSIDLHSEETIVSRKSIRQMTSNEPGFHPLGWRWVSNSGVKWRTGSFAGTSALALSQSDGLTFVFITNTSPWVGARFPYEVNRMMARALRGVDSWPKINLFNPYSINFENYVEVNEADSSFNQKRVWSWDLTNLS